MIHKRSLLHSLVYYHALLFVTIINPKTLLGMIPPVKEQVAEVDTLANIKRKPRKHPRRHNSKLLLENHVM
jgi:hypothetical protein